MSQANVELCREGVEAFNQRDIERLAELTSPEFEFAAYLATLIETTTYRGLDGFRRYFEDADAAWEEIQVRLSDDFRDLGERIVLFGELQGKGRASGLEVRVPLAWVAEIHDGKLTRLRSYENAADALKAVGLAG
jgi:ketosteroid isomerase-like protein